MTDQTRYDITKTIGYQFSKLAQLYTQRMDQELSPHNITNQAWSILATVVMLDIRRPSDIGDHLGITRQSLSRSIKEMEARGLITREIDDNDSRGRLVIPSKAGQDLFSIILPSTFHISNHFRAKLKQSEFESLRSLLFILLEGENH